MTSKRAQWLRIAIEFEIYAGNLRRMWLQMRRGIQHTKYTILAVDSEELVHTRGTIYLTATISLEHTIHCGRKKTRSAPSGHRASMSELFSLSGRVPVSLMLESRLGYGLARGDFILRTLALFTAGTPIGECVSA